MNLLTQPGSREETIELCEALYTGDSGTDKGDPDEETPA